MFFLGCLKLSVLLPSYSVKRMYLIKLKKPKKKTKTINNLNKLLIKDMILDKT